MALYRWQGVDAQGQFTEAYSFAVSYRQLLLDLRAHYITPTLLRRCWHLRQRSIKQHVTQLLDQLAWLLQAQIPLATALQQLSLATTHTVVHSFAVQLHQRVMGGSSLSEALGSLSTWLAPEYLAFIAAGEANGQLADMLSEVTRQQRQQQQLIERIRQALRYPMIILLSTLCLLAAMLLWVVPHYTRFLAELHTSLPPLTRSVLHLTHLIRPLLICLLFMSGLVVAAHFYLQKHATLQRHWHAFILRLPTFGRLVQHSQLYRWCYLMTAGTAAQLPLLDCLQLACRSLRNHALQHCLTQAAQSVLQGRPLHHSLKTCDSFTAYDLTLIAIGEQTATLPKVFDCMARHYEQQMLKSIHLMTTWLEPLLLLSLGGLTAVLIVAFYQPMIHLGLHL